MGSTFMGLETAKRGITAQRAGLYVTSNNVSNANTEGYSRQRVTFKADNPYPVVSVYDGKTYGQMGTGVQVGTVERIRDSFLDLQYRDHNNNLSYYASKSDALSQMEGVMNDLTDEGLNRAFDNLWKSLQVLSESKNADTASARTVVKTSAQALVDQLRLLNSSLTTIQKNLKAELESTAKNVNTLLTQIDEINKQIAKVEPNGYLPNDLYDTRDALVDQLSSLVDIKVSYNEPGGNALKIAEGTMNIEIIGANGQSAGTILNGITNEKAEMQVSFDGTTGLVNSLQFGSISINADQFAVNGEIKALVEAYGYMSNGAEKGMYPEMLAELDEIAKVFMDKFNEVHKQGYTLKGTNGQDFFDIENNNELNKGLAARIKVSDVILESTDNIAASLNQNAGDGTNATALAAIQDLKLAIGGTTTTIQDYYQNVIAEMGIQAQKNITLASSSAALVNSAEERRMSISAVSIDEEMTNMIQFQHAYNAAARIITLQDEILDKLINGMGVVGR
ncbi:flagellar hook-associated protein FlgK [Bacillus sp. NPDC077027]|uniref:flagellar hook-associated protein FlgK n=1 Tax=Bacillus sp. NPDC077027 TaxID=3390548 RepID=UPI003CFD57AD